MTDKLRRKRRNFYCPAEAPKEPSEMIFRIGYVLLGSRGVTLGYFLGGMYNFPLRERTLVIQFKDSKLCVPTNAYVYYNVPFKVYKDLLNCEHPGKFFHKVIRENYLYAKLWSFHTGEVDKEVLYEHPRRPRW